MNRLNMQIFPTFVAFGTLGNKMKELNKRLVRDIWVDIKNNPSPPQTSGHGDMATTSNLEDKYDSFRELGEYISEWVKPSIKQAGFYIKNATCGKLQAKVIRDPAGYHMPHSHDGSSYWTGVYYPSSGIKDGKWLEDDLDLDANLPIIESLSLPRPGSIVLLDPIECIKVSSLREAAFNMEFKNNMHDGTQKRLVDRYPNHGHPICMLPRQSAIVMFPTFLPHMVTPHRDPDLERHAIPFHIKLDY